MQEKSDSVCIGEKDIKAYIFAVQTQASYNSEIIIKARGKMISRAVDVSQISLNKILKGWHLNEVRIGTDDLRIGENEIRKTSFIEISMKNGQPE